MFEDARNSQGSKLDNRGRRSDENKDLTRERLSRSEAINVLAGISKGTPEEQLTEKQKKSLRALEKLSDSTLYDFLDVHFEKRLKQILGPMKHYVKEVRPSEPKDIEVREINENESFMELFDNIYDDVVKSSFVGQCFKKDKLDEMKEIAKDYCKDDLESIDEGFADMGLDLDSEYDIDDLHGDASGERDPILDMEEDEEGLSGVEECAYEFLVDLGYSEEQIKEFAQKYLENKEYDYDKFSSVITNIENSINDNLKQTIMKDIKGAIKAEFGRGSMGKRAPISKLKNYNLTTLQLKFLLDNHKQMGTKMMFKLFNQPTQSRFKEDLSLFMQCKGADVSDLKESKIDNMHTQIDYLCFNYIMTPEEQMKIMNNWVRIGQYDMAVPEAYEGEGRLQDFLDNLK